MARTRPGFLIVPALFLTPVFWSPDLPLPQAFRGQVEKFLADLQKATTLDQALPARDGLVLLGRGVTPQVAKALEKAGRKARWSLLQVLALLGGKDGGRALRQVLVQPRWRSREGCLCLAALGLPLESRPELEALADLAGAAGERMAWARICGLLALARPISSTGGRPEVSSRTLEAPQTPQEKAAVLLFLAARGSSADLASALGRFWPEKVLSWGDRLVARAACLAVARRKILGWEGPLLSWLASGKTRPEDRRALALALGALEVPSSSPSLKGFSDPREWACFFSLGSEGGGKGEEERIRARLGLPTLDDVTKGALAGAFARCLAREDLLRKAPSFLGDHEVREVLSLELARRILLARRGDPFLDRAGRRTWDPAQGTEGFVVAALASRGVLQNKGPLPQGWSLWAKAVRGEVPPPVVGEALEKALRKRWAWPTQLLESAWNEEGMAILLGASEFYLQKYPGLAPPRGKAPLPLGAPYRGSPFYGWLEAFLAARPLFSPPLEGGGKKG